MLNPNLMILKDFCEEYIRLAESILLIDSSDFEILKKAEEEVTIEYYQGIRRKGFESLNAIKTHFALRNVELIEQTLKKYPNLERNVVFLDRFINKHRIEIRNLGLSFKNNEITPLNLYCNYVFVVDYLEQINSQLKLYGKK